MKKMFLSKYREIKAALSRKPFLTVGVLMGVFFVLLVAGAYLAKPGKTTEEEKKSPLKVRVYTIGSVPKIKVQARIEKENIVKIVAQSGGIVSGIWVTEGQEVASGTTLLSLSTNYWGGNAFTIQKQIAKASLDNLEAVYPLQTELLKKQKEIAEKNDSNNDELRSISEKSLADTKSLMSLNEEILNSLNANLTNYEATNTAGVNNSLILSSKQLKSQYQSAVNSLQSSIRTLEYQTDSGENPAGLSDLTREMTLKQLEIQEKTLNLSKEIAGLQYSLAVVNEGLSYPSAPFSGVVQKTHVRLGQNVTPGTVLFTLSGASQSISAEALVTKRIAGQISQLEPSEIVLGNQKIEAFPSFISTEAVEGTLYQVKFDLNNLTEVKLTDGEYVEVYLPLGYPDTSKSAPFIPIDSVYQTGTGAFVYLVDKDNIARANKVILGEVYGQFVEVNEGLTAKDRVILDRNVITGDKINVN